MTKFDPIRRTAGFDAAASGKQTSTTLQKKVKRGEATTFDIADSDDDAGHADSARPLQKTTATDRAENTSAGAKKPILAAPSKPPSAAVLKQRRQRGEPVLYAAMRGLDECFYLPGQRTCGGSGLVLEEGPPALACGPFDVLCREASHLLSNWRKSPVTSASRTTNCWSPGRRTWKTSLARLPAARWDTLDECRRRCYGRCSTSKHFRRSQQRESALRVVLETLLRVLDIGCLR